MRTVPEMASSKRNGELLRLAEREFDVFLTVDRQLQHQQQLSVFRIAVISCWWHEATVSWISDR